MTFRDFSFSTNSFQRKFLHCLYIPNHHSLPSIRITPKILLQKTDNFYYWHYMTIFWHHTKNICDKMMIFLQKLNNEEKYE